MSLLTEADEALLPAALRHNGGFHLATKWYLNGWTPLPKQYAFHQLPVQNVTFLAGIAAGKTTAVAASYLIDCLTIPYFRALNTSVTSIQAELTFEAAMSWIEGNPRLEHLIDDISLRPYPKIIFKNYSEWHFRTAGKDARFIRGQEFDRINYDEAGLDYVGLAIKTLRGRLRGVRPDGTPRMARLDVTTTPTDAQWLKERFYRGWRGHPTFEPKYYRSIRATTYDNTHLTPDQIALIEADYPDEMIDVELRAMFPSYGNTTFPSNHIDACTDMALNDLMVEATRPESGRPKAGWRVEEHPRHGIVLWERPPESGGRYVLAGDPGTGDPPKRNAAVVMVFNTATKPYELVYFHWVSGKGSYRPFLRSFKYAIERYKPVLRSIDATGPQKALEELAFETEGIVVEGLNFQRDKDAMINALSIAISEHWFRWPVIKGLLRQLRSYRREDDKKQDQDIVMALAQIAFLCRYLPEEIEEEVEHVHRSTYRRSRRIRTTVARRR